MAFSEQDYIEDKNRTEFNRAAIDLKAAITKLNNVCTSTNRILIGIDIVKADETHIVQVLINTKESI